MKGTSPSRGCGEAVAIGIESAMMYFLDFINTSEGEVMSIIVIGIDLAKNIFVGDQGVMPIRCSVKYSPDPTLPDPTLPDPTLHGTDRFDGWIAVHQHSAAHQENGKG